MKKIEKRNKNEKSKVQHKSSKMARKLRIFRHFTRRIGRYQFILLIDINQIMFFIAFGCISVVSFFRFSSFFCRVFLFSVLLILLFPFFVFQSLTINRSQSLLIVLDSHPINFTGPETEQFNGTSIKCLHFDRCCPTS